MTIKIPVRTVYNSNGDPQGLSEFQTGEVVGYLHGGTGLSTIGTTGQILVVNDSANGFEFAAGFGVADARNAISVTDTGGDGSLSYNSSNGVLTYTGPSAAEARAHFSAGTGLTLSNGQYSITNTGVVAGIYGSASQVPVFTINAQGQIDSAGTVNVAGVSSTSYDSATGDFIINTADGNTFTTSINLNPFTTTDLAEGTNRYYTDARARSAISVTDAGGDGSLAYNNSTGVLTYTGPSATEVRAHFSAGTGVTLSSGQISIGQAVGTTDNVSFNNVTVNGTLTSDDITSANVTATGNVIVQGNLTVNGTTTTINSTTVSINDKNIVLADSAADATEANGAGITINGADATFNYASVGDKWVSNKQIDAPVFNTTSDIRLKDNIQTINNALDKVASIRGVTFTWKENGNASMGIIAQEVEEVAPEVISETNGYKAVNYDGLIGLLIESIKDLKKEIEALKQN
jgi:hypothetical protein